MELSEPVYSYASESTPSNKTLRPEKEAKSRSLVIIVILLVICLVVSITAIVCTFVAPGGKQGEESDELEQVKTLLMRLNETVDKQEAVELREEIELLKKDNAKLLQRLNETEEQLETADMREQIKMLTENNARLLLRLNETEEQLAAVASASADTRDRQQMISTSLESLSSTVAAYHDNQGSAGAVGSDYIRWGRKTCGNTSVQLYSGLAAGQNFEHTGGAAEYLCLPLVPEYSSGGVGANVNNIRGVEYQTHGNNAFPQQMEDRNVPCVRCYVSKSNTLMIPAKRTCPSSWTKEYEGYLMSGYYTHIRAYNYVCVDKEPEALDGSQANNNGALMYFVRTACSFFEQCPPYRSGLILTCVVCSK